MDLERLGSEWCGLVRGDMWRRYRVCIGQYWRYRVGVDEMEGSHAVWKVQMMSQRVRVDDKQIDGLILMDKFDEKW